MQQTRPNGVSDLNQSKLKQQAVSFYSQYNVTVTLEKLLNTMFLDEPEDVYGYMSEYFHGLSKEPVISSLEGYELLDSNGDPSLALTMHCIVNGTSKPIHYYTHPIWSNTRQREEKIGQSSPTKVKDTQTKKNHSTDEVNEDNLSDIEEASLSWSEPLETVNNINEVLQGIPLKAQVQIDDHITKLSKNRSPSLHPSTQAAISRLSAISTSMLSHTPLFLSLSNTFQTESDSFSIPIPLTAIVAGGQQGIGKLKVSGFYLAPVPSSSIVEGIKHVISTYREVGHMLAAKNGPLGLATLVNGAYCMAADKPEVILDLLRESGGETGLQLNREVLVFIDIGAEMMFDEERKKYEFITGQWKTGEEMVTIYSNLTSAYPGLTGFIDPLHPKDTKSWQLLLERLGNDCLLIADKTLSDLPLMKPPSHSDDEYSSIPFISCATISSSSIQPLSGCFAEATHIKGLCRYLMFSSHQQQTSDSLNFNADLAVALKCKFIKLDAPTGLTSTTVLSRLMQIQKQLESLEIQKPSSALMFSCMP